MKRIYTAANLADAHLVRDLLQHAGIAVHIFNEYAMAALGEVPMGSAYPQLWISQLHQEQHARAVKPIPANSSCAGIAARRWRMRNRDHDERIAIANIRVLRDKVRLLFLQRWPR